MAQAQSLMAEAEQVRKSELSGVIAGIKSQMKQYGITAADLGGATGAKSIKFPLVPYLDPRTESIKLSKFLRRKSVVHDVTHFMREGLETKTLRAAEPGSKERNS
jgi:hypothetical protein